MSNNKQKNSSTFVDDLLASKVSEENRLVTALDRYHLENTLLGSGSYGEVLLAHDMKDDKNVAIKVVKRKNVKSISTEIRIQSEFNHPNVVSLLDFYTDVKNIYLVMDLAKNSSVAKFIESNAPNKRNYRKNVNTNLDTKDNSFVFDEAKVFMYFFQTMLGVDYLHYKNVIHKDIKPENLLIDKNDNVKIADFGCSEIILSETVDTKYNGTLPYMAPELIKKQPYGKKVDIWSCGVLLYAQFHGVVPFDITNADNLKESIVNLDNKYVYYKKGVTNDVKELISKMLDSDVQKRATLDDVFNSKWMNKNYKLFYYDLHQERKKKFELETREIIEVDLKNEDELISQKILPNHVKNISLNSLLESTYNRVYKTESDWSVKPSPYNERLKLVNPFNLAEHEVESTYDSYNTNQKKIKTKKSLKKKSLIEDINGSTGKSKFGCRFFGCCSSRKS